MRGRGFTGMVQMLMQMLLKAGNAGKEAAFTGKVLMLIQMWLEARQV